MPMRNRGLKIWQASLALACGVFATLAGLYLAIHVAGPIIRSVLGTPRGFNEDYATREAWLQARAVQLLSVGAIFLVAGFLFGVAKCPKSLASALWAANPFSIGLGYWFAQRLWSGNGPGEYFGYVGLGLLALLAPFVLAPCALLGIRMGRRLRSVDGGGYPYDARA